MIKFVDGYYDEETGISTVIYQDTKSEKKYIGTSKLCEEDREFESKFFGCQNAEIKALIAAAKEERAGCKKDLHEIENFVKACLCTKKFDKESPTAKVVFRQLNLKKRELGLHDRRIQMLEEQLEVRNKNFDIIHHSEEEE